MPTFLESLRDRRRDRGRDTPFLDEWLGAGGVGSGFLTDQARGLLEDRRETGTSRRPILADNANALLAAGGVLLSGGRDAWGNAANAFISGGQVDRQRAEQARAEAERQQFEQAIGAFTADMPPEIQAIAPFMPEAAFDYYTQHVVAEPEAADFGEINTLRAQFNGLTDEFRDVEAAYRRIESLDDSAAGDLALIFNFMKMLDPDSVVRESEFATAQNAAGVPEIVRNIWNRLLTGERLGEGQRADFLNQAQNLYQASLNGYNSMAEAYRELALELNFDPDQVVLPRDLPGGDAAAAGGGFNPRAPGLPPLNALNPIWNY